MVDEIAARRTDLHEPTCPAELQASIDEVTVNRGLDPVFRRALEYATHDVAADRANRSSSRRWHTAAPHPSTRGCSADSPAARHRPRPPRTCRREQHHARTSSAIPAGVPLNISRTARTQASMNRTTHISTTPQL
jgi:hypothetical protein